MAELFALAVPQDPPPPPPVMPSFPIRACIIGKHLAGKSSILHKLAEKYRISVIQVDHLVEHSIQYENYLNIILLNIFLVVNLRNWTPAMNLR